MIRLHVEEYCQDCDQFSPSTETQVMYAGNGPYLRDTTVYCKNRDRCRGIYEIIKQNVNKAKEE